jgi:type II secretory pathway pseudopilin PulG
MPYLLPLLLLSFVLANGLAYIDWAARRDEARAAASCADIKLRAARNAVATYPAQIAALEASAARLLASNLTVSASYDIERSTVLSLRLARARAILAA